MSKENRLIFKVMTNVELVPFEDVLNWTKGSEKRAVEQANAVKNIFKLTPPNQPKQ